MLRPEAHQPPVIYGIYIDIMRQFSRQDACVDELHVKTAKVLFVVGLAGSCRIHMPPSPTNMLLKGLTSHFKSHVSKATFPLGKRCFTLEQARELDVLQLTCNGTVELAGSGGGLGGRKAS